MVPMYLFFVLTIVFLIYLCVWYCLYDVLANVVKIILIISYHVSCTHHILILILYHEPVFHIFFEYRHSNYYFKSHKLEVIVLLQS